MRYSYLIVIVCASLMLSGCMKSSDTDKTAALELEKVASIGEEPITRLAFVPTNDKYKPIDIIVHSEELLPADILPEAGE